MRRDIVINIGLLLGTVVLFFGGIEIALRVTGLVEMQQPPPNLYKASEPRIGYELLPNNEEEAFRSTIKTNSLGFRSPELDPKQPLIAVLGDSITFGYGVENHETLPARLEELLSEYQFLNTAAPGYHLGQQTAIYETKVQSLNPDGLILVFYWNDFNPDTGWLDEDGVVQSSQAEPTPWYHCRPIDRGMLRFIPGKCWLDLHSAFYVALRKFVNYRSGLQALEHEQASAIAQPEFDDVTEEQLAAYAVQLDALNALLPPGMPKLFVIWPDRFLHTPSRSKLRTIAEQRGFTVVDLYDTLGNEAKVLGWDTVHPHADTLKEAAGVVATKIREWNWLK